MRNTTERYFAEVSAHGLPTPQEAKKNFTRYAELRSKLYVASTEQARRAIQDQMTALSGRIAKGYLRFVIGEARKRTRDSELLPDLISAGNEGLLCAIQKFDLAQDTQFLTFAFYWVRVKINNVLYRKDDVNISVHRRRKDAKAPSTRQKEGGESAPPTISSLDDYELASDADTAQEASDNDARAMRYLTAAELPLRERLVVQYVLGMRSTPKSFQDISMIFYTLDRSLVTPSEVEALYERGLARLKDWAALCGEASIREDLGT